MISKFIIMSLCLFGFCFGVFACGDDDDSADGDTDTESDDDTDSETDSTKDAAAWISDGVYTLTFEQEECLNYEYGIDPLYLICESKKNGSACEFELWSDGDKDEFNAFFVNGEKNLTYYECDEVELDFEKEGGFITGTFSCDAFSKFKPKNVALIGGFNFQI